jgi:hypothetical protein
MNAVLVALSVVLPLLPVILFPTRFFGRGTMSTLLGAGLLVGMMMALYVGLTALTGDQSSGAKSVAAADIPGVSAADISALEQLLQ